MKKCTFKFNTAHPIVTRRDMSEQQQALAVQHIEEWISVMSRDDLMLSVTLHHVLVNEHGVRKVMLHKQSQM